MPVGKLSKELHLTPTLSPRRGGFTLAEVLITLVIIGVIAAITVPSLMQQTNKKEDAARVKKAYSVLQNSIHKITLDKGYAQGDYSFISNTDDFMDAFEKTVNVAKRCKNSNDCIAAKTYFLNGNEDSFGSSGNAIITQDGIMYSFLKDSTLYDVFGLNDEDKNNYMGRVWVDINGKNKPQKYGRDLFAFVLIQGKGILPAGYANNSSDCNTTSYGRTCTAKVLKDDDINY